MSKEPLISIIMPVHNAEKRLEISIDSILNQNYRNFELILINDGSIDKSGGICNFYEKIDPRIVVIHQKNSGVSVARNSGIEKAKGDYLTFIDSDDTLESHAYKEVIDKLNEHDADMVMFGMSFDYYKEEVFSENKEMAISVDFSFSNEEIKNCFFDLYEQNYFSSVWNKIIKTSIVKDREIRFEKEMAILEDFKFVLDVLEHSTQFIAMNAVYYHYYNDLTVSSLVRRSNIDYMKNFKVLDYRLRDFAEKIGLIRNEDYEKINGMILRYYLIAIERIFLSNANGRKKYDELTRYMIDEDIKKAIDNARCSGKRLKIVHWLMCKKLIRTLWFLFSVNDSWRQIKIRLSKR